MPTSQKSRIEIVYSTKRHTKQLNELLALGGEEILDDNAACRNYLLKGMQRFLFTCIEKGIDVNQGIIDLSVQGEQFDQGLPYCSAGLAELVQKLSAEESGYQVAAAKVTDVTSPSIVEQIGEKQQAGHIMVDLQEKQNSGADGSDGEDWSSFAGITGLKN